MLEYIENGSKLGWLIDPFQKEVIIYRPGTLPEILENPSEISGEPVLRGFVLPVPEVWTAIEDGSAGAQSADSLQILRVQRLQVFRNKQTILSDQFVVEPDLAAAPFGPLN
jgi:hypothetical protein